MSANNCSGSDEPKVPEAAPGDLLDLNEQPDLHLTRDGDGVLRVHDNPDAETTYDFEDCDDEGRDLPPVERAANRGMRRLK